MTSKAFNPPKKFKKYYLKINSRLIHLFHISHPHAGWECMPFKRVFSTSCLVEDHTVREILASKEDCIVLGQKCNWRSHNPVEQSFGDLIETHYVV